MIPENVEEELLAERELADACAVTKTVQARSSAVRESLVAFKFGGSSLLGAERMLHTETVLRSLSDVHVRQQEEEGPTPVRATVRQVEQE